MDSRLDSRLETSAFSLCEQQLIPVGHVPEADEWKSYALSNGGQIQAKLLFLMKGSLINIFHGLPVGGRRGFIQQGGCID